MQRLNLTLGPNGAFQLPSSYSPLNSPTKSSRGGDGEDSPQSDGRSPLASRDGRRNRSPL